MKHTLKLHYYIQNCGDGSAALTLCESKELAEYAQGDDNGWGEPCLGSILLESDSPITVASVVETRANLLLNLLNDEEDDRARAFIEEFYPDGPPVFTVVTDVTYKDKSFHRNKVYVGDELIDTLYRKKEESGGNLEMFLNGL